MDSNRDSFNRFGTELSQIILSYLPLNEKFGFECVSKRWQRLIYNKVTKLDISQNFYTVLVNGMPIIYRNQTKYLNLYLKKLKSIKEIDLDVLDIKTIKLIVRELNGLQTIRFNRINSFDLSLLRHKYSQSLTTFEFKDYYMGWNLNNYNFVTFFRLFSYDLQLFMNEKFENLREITLSQTLSYNIFKNFTDIYCSQITKLSFYFMPEYKYDLEIPFCFNQDVIPVLRQISRYKNLKSLDITLKSIDIQFEYHLPSIEKQLEMIAYFCPHIKHLGLCFGDKNKGLDFDIFVLIQNFNSLISLSLEYNNSIVRKHARSESMMNSLKLKHLSIKTTGVLYSKMIINDLQTHDFNDYLLKDIAGLKHLSKLVLSVHNITEHGICYFIRNLPKLSSIDLNNNLMTKEIRDCLIRNAVRNPKIVFKIQFKCIENEILNGLPNNLIIKSFE